MTLISFLASNEVKTHHKISSIINARTTPTGSFVHSWRLNTIASRLRAVENAIVLLIDDVRHAKMTGLSRLTPRAAVNMADCTGLPEFRTRGRCDDDFGDRFPITEISIAVSKT